MKATVEDELVRAEEALDAGEFEAALASATKALHLAPSNADALELKGHALAALGDIDGADEAFAELVKREPGNAGALLLAADAKIRLPGDDLKRADEGLALLDRARPLARRDPTLTIELELLRGIALSTRGELPAALSAFERVLASDPEHPEARLEAAIARFELGRLDDAWRDLSQLARDFPDDAWAQHYLGLIAERRGTGAEAYFRRARELAPDDFPPPVTLSAEEFDRAVAQAVEALPTHARPHLENVILTTQPLPSDEDLREGLSPTILGVFQGTPVDERLATEASHHETARIVLFQKNLERFARTREELLEEIRITVLHEVGHLLGLDEDELAERGLD
jgi:predicted Zn-dependent protease with MMP-like domain/Flp pilus assembly protein TadD